jgi:hypothetical protein
MADLKSLIKEAEDIRDSMQKLLEGKSAEQVIAIKKENDEYKNSLKILKEINTQISEQKTRLKESVETYKQSEQSLKSLSGLQEKLKTTERQRLEMQSQLSDLDPKKIAAFNKISDLNFDLAKLSAEDVISRAAITQELDEMIGRMTNLSAAEEIILGKLVEQKEQAEGIASLTESQQKQLEAQLETYEGIKKTIGGILDTAAILTSGPGGILGMSLIGAGKFLGKMGEVRGELGGIAEFGTTALAFFDDNAVANAKELASQFGGINNVSGELQASTSLISVNMGISGVEAAGLIGSFARLNGNSQETALNLTKASQEFAAQNGLIPGALMADLADNTEAFALFGKEGGKNMIQAAGAAAKMGVSLKTMTGLADNLLDFENSINAEMELGAMLGKDINLDKARALAYQGDLAGATQETLRALGGVDAFNKMDYFSKKKTAELMGTSVEELQKMVTNQEQAATMGGKINATFSLVGETINAGLNKYLGTSLEALGGMVMAGAQLGGSFAQMGFDIKGMASKIPIVGKLFGGGKSPIASVSEKASEAGGAGDKIGPAGEKSGGGLKSLAEGLKEMGNAKVLFGALNLIPTALGLVTMVVGIPSLMAISAFGTGAGLGLEFIGVGLQAMGNPQALMGAGVLAAAGLAFGIMTVGVVGLAAIALGGKAAGAGLIGLTAGLVSLGEAAMTGVPFAGLALLAGFGIALIPLTYALSLLAPLIESIGNVIVGTITAIANGISTVVSSIGQFMTQVLPLMSMDNAAGLLAMAGGFAALAISLAAFAFSSLLAIPGMIAVGMFLSVGGGDLLGGGGGAEGGGKDGMDELIAEIKGLRADLASGKIGVNMDGQKVTSKITSVVDKGSTNSYAK